MATPRRPSRPGASRRAPEPEDDYVEGEEGELEDLPPAKPQGPSVAVMVGAVAGLAFAGILAYAIFSKSGYLLEVENTSMDLMQDVVVKVNGTEYKLGAVSGHEIQSAQADCSPGNSVEVTFKLPNRPPTTKRLTKDASGKELDLDFGQFHGTCRIRVQPDGIEEVSW